MKKVAVKKIVLIAVIALGVALLSAFVFVFRGQQPKVGAVGHVHMTDGGEFRAKMEGFIRENLGEELSLYITGSSRDLRTYLTDAIGLGKIERGTIFSYNHREVHRLLEAARPLIAKFPGRYSVRTEFAPLADNLGQLHLVWVNAYVITYNPNLISRSDVPSTLKALVEFNQPIAVPTTGCIGGWGTMALYHHLGEDAFRKLMTNTSVKGCLTTTTDAVQAGTVAVGISTLQNVMVRDGKVGVIWPEEGAIAKPAFLAIADNPTEQNLQLADAIMSSKAAELYANEFNMASALPDGPVPAIVRDNNFNFVFIPTEAIVSLDIEAKVDAIVGE